MGALQPWGRGLSLGGPGQLSVPWSRACSPGAWGEAGRHQERVVSRASRQGGVLGAGKGAGNLAGPGAHTEQGGKCHVPRSWTKGMGSWGEALGVQ